MNENERLSEIERKIDAILTHIAIADEMIETVVTEVKPALDQLMSSPVFRMIAGVPGKGKK